MTETLSRRRRRRLTSSPFSSLCSLVNVKTMSKKRKQKAIEPSLPKRIIKADDLYFLFSRSTADYTRNSRQLSTHNEKKGKRQERLMIVGLLSMSTDSPSRLDWRHKIPIMTIHSSFDKRKCLSLSLAVAILKRRKTQLKKKCLYHS